MDKDKFIRPEISITTPERATLSLGFEKCDRPSFPPSVASLCAQADRLRLYKARAAPWHSHSEANVSVRSCVLPAATFRELMKSRRMASTQDATAL